MKKLGTVLLFVVLSGIVYGQWVRENVQYQLIKNGTDLSLNGVAFKDITELKQALTNLSTNYDGSVIILKNSFPIETSKDKDGKEIKNDPLKDLKELVKINEVEKFEKEFNAREKMIVWSSKSNSLFDKKGATPYLSTVRQIANQDKVYVLNWRGLETGLVDGKMTYEPMGYEVSDRYAVEQKIVKANEQIKKITDKIDILNKDILLLTAKNEKKEVIEGLHKSVTDLYKENAEIEKKVETLKKNIEDTDKIVEQKQIHYAFLKNIIDNADDCFMFYLDLDLILQATMTWKECKRDLLEKQIDNFKFVVEKNSVFNEDLTVAQQCIDFITSVLNGNPSKELDLNVLGAYRVTILNKLFGTTPSDSIKDLLVEKPYERHWSHVVIHPVKFWGSIREEMKKKDVAKTAVKVPETKPAEVLKKNL